MPIRKLAILFLFLLAAPAWAEQDWLATRQQAFAAWQKTHPGADAAIADLKAKTAALVAAAGTLSTDITAPPATRRVPGAITEIWDDPAAPQMVVIPAGSYTMGSPALEPRRNANEGPQHRVTINYSFAAGKYPVTRNEYAAFIAATGRPDAAACTAPNDYAFRPTPGINWHDPGFAQTGSDPVVCVSWNDANAYVQWLSLKTGQRYRLLTEAEWEYAARAGTTTARYWGEEASHDQANYGHELSPVLTPGSMMSGRDQWLYTSPIGSFPSNPLGLYDMLGNVNQWVADCYLPSYAAPTDGSAVSCATHFARGGAWNSTETAIRSAYRLTGGATSRSVLIGFRVARTL